MIFSNQALILIFRKESKDQDIKINSICSTLSKCLSLVINVPPTFIQQAAIQTSFIGILLQETYKLKHTFLQHPDRHL